MLHSVKSKGKPLRSSVSYHTTCTGNIKTLLHTCPQQKRHGSCLRSEVAQTRAHSCELDTEALLSTQRGRVQNIATHEEGRIDELSLARPSVVSLQ